MFCLIKWIKSKIELRKISSIRVASSHYLMLKVLRYLSFTEQLD
ncbi:hypothetical protein OIU84_003850 [Salix udensis]|uniref:Uncharacterized protein n=1 Tax=Salix udensis TaxID=889485 RepID=A0AAD6P323_9ROSI|nr:hypothetical protein OIU84_003850 [Salix udensis]